MAERRHTEMKVILECRQRAGQSIRRMRKSLKMTQQRVAYLLGWTRTTVVAIERGTQSVSIDQLVRLANLFRTSVNALLPFAYLNPNEYLRQHGPIKLL